MIKGKLDVNTLNPTRKTRSKTKRPKFASIRLELSGEMNTDSTVPEQQQQQQQQQLNLFPLHPEEDRDTHTQEEEEVEYLFTGSDGGATTLTDLLDHEITSSSIDHNDDGDARMEGVDDDERDQLERTALRNKERDDSEELKWVSYSEVLVNHHHHHHHEDVMSSSCGGQVMMQDGVVRCKNKKKKKKKKKKKIISNSDSTIFRSCSNRVEKLCLKLDYEEIMDAWSHKGSLFIHQDSPHTVPQLLPPIPTTTTTGEMQLGLWAVPEMSTGGSNSSGSSSIKLMKEEDCFAVNVSAVGGEDLNKLGQREASVLRYKQKRHNRLFAKKIRYEVRKLNAEKRPRIKGRFVKRC